MTTDKQRLRAAVNEDAKNHQRAVFFRHQIEKHPPHRDADAEAFISPTRVNDDDLSVELAKNFLIAVQEGREPMQELSDERPTEEEGGPFVMTSAGTEFAEGVDDSNPADAEAEAFPTANRKAG